MGSRNVRRLLGGGCYGYISLRQEYVFMLSVETRPSTRKHANTATHAEVIFSIEYQNQAFEHSNGIPPK